MVEVVNMEHVGKAKIKQELPGFGQLEECRKWERMVWRQNNGKH